MGASLRRSVRPVVPLRRVRIAVLRDLVRRGWRPPARLRLTDAQADRLLDDIVAITNEARHPPGTRPRSEALTLTPAELRVLTFAASGLTKAEIAAELQVSEETVRSQTATARDRIGARNVTHAVAIAITDGLIYLARPETGGTE